MPGILWAQHMLFNFKAIGMNRLDPAAMPPYLVTDLDRENLRLMPQNGPPLRCVPPCAQQSQRLRVGFLPRAGRGTRGMRSLRRLAPQALGQALFVKGIAMMGERR